MLTEIVYLNAGYFTEYYQKSVRTSSRVKQSYALQSLYVLCHA
jgi:hypothetical protein